MTLHFLLSTTLIKGILTRIIYFIGNNNSIIIVIIIISFSAYLPVELQ